jgi:vitamin K-dependent gamma-carboxylase-like protein
MNAWWNAYWFECGVSRAKLNLFRLVFFTVVAVDCFLDLSHAPAYGAGGFNVSHLPWLDPLLPLPTRAGFLIGCVLGSYLALQAAFGVATAIAVRVLTVLWGYRYFISQLDSFQHHYLVFLLLLIACLIPWDQAREPRDPQDPTIAHWAIRLLVVQVAIVYFWAAVSKMTGHWVDGTALAGEVTPGDSWIVQAVFDKASASELIQATLGFAGVAKLVLALEILLTVMLLYRPLWPFAILVGVPFHAGVEIAGFRIGRFSYFMIAFYVLLLPDRWMERLGRGWRAVTAAAVQPLVARAPGPAAGLLIAAALAGGGALILARVPLDSRPAVALPAFLLSLGAALRAARRGSRGGIVGAGLAALAAGALLFALYRVSDAVPDYYRLLGGSSRRLGDLAQSERAYRRFVALRPDDAKGYLHLAQVEKQRGDVDGARVHAGRAVEIDPGDDDAVKLWRELGGEP